MNPAGAIVIYILIWWCVFFAVLPIGVRPDENDIPGADRGAPSDPRLKQKAIWTTGIAFILWLAAVAVILSGVIDYRD
ncbi:MAG: DUF1467 family protein [Alphaproteobacteria bacterium]|nr:DUF1467 family protein [Alphaproteobacteria bacterium]